MLVTFSRARLPRSRPRVAFVASPLRGERTKVRGVELLNAFGLAFDKTLTLPSPFFKGEATRRSRSN
jgi:hypothetical protein